MVTEGFKPILLLLFWPSQLIYFHNFLCVYINLGAFTWASSYFQGRIQDFLLGWAKTDNSQLRQVPKFKCAGTYTVVGANRNFGPHELIEISPWNSFLAPTLTRRWQRNVAINKSCQCRKQKNKNIFHKLMYNVVHEMYKNFVSEICTKFLTQVFKINILTLIHHELKHFNDLHHITLLYICQYYCLTCAHFPC